MEQRWAVQPAIYRTEPDVQVLVHEQRPDGEVKGELLLIHGLEGSSTSGYALSMAYAALERGFAVHRFNLRGCGGTEHLALSSYHAGQTSDLREVLRQIRGKTSAPIFVCGYSLGGNIALKLAGELGEATPDLVTGVCGVSVPIDLAASAAAIERPTNFLYQNRFLDRLKDRIRRRHVQAPEMYTLEHLPKVRTITNFDDYYTAKLFGFGTAANYFRTQSSNQFLEHIRIPGECRMVKHRERHHGIVLSLHQQRRNPNVLQELVRGLSTAATWDFWLAAVHASGWTAW